MQVIVGPYGMQSPHPHRRSMVAMYDDCIRHAQRAEELGYDGFALTEHSFWYDGYCPSLLPVLAAVARRTRTIKLVTGALLLPQHDPLKVAEEAAVVDQLSGGRLVLGLGAGYRPEEFLGHGVPQGRWGARFIEAYEVVSRALTGERFSFAGEFYDYDDVAIGARPVQDPVPMWVCGGFRGWTPRSAGRRGWSLCTTGDMNKDGLGIFEQYEAAADAAGVPRDQLRRGLFRDVMIARSERDADTIVWEDYISAMLDQFVGFGFLDYENPDGSKLTELPPKLVNAVAASQTRGDAAAVRDQLGPVIDARPDMLIIRLGWANFRSDRALESMEVFAREVLPFLRDEVAAR